MAFAEYLKSNGHGVPGEVRAALRGFTDHSLDLHNGIGRGEIVWPPSEYHPIVALAQHSGARTRLIDFTTDAYVALYFAAKSAVQLCRGRKAPDGLCVYVIEGDQSLTLHRFDKEDDPHDRRYCYQLIEPVADLNERLWAQRGVFLAYLQLRFHPNHATDVVSLEGYFEELEAECLADGMPGLASKLHKVTLDTRHARELLWMLGKARYDAATLMRGPEGCVEAVRESCEIGR